MGVLAPFFAIVVAGVSERIQSDSANQPISPGRKCAASATYWVAIAISREARGSEDAPTSGGSDRGEELQWAFPRDGTRVIRPTGAPPPRAQVACSPDLDFATLRRRAGQPGLPTGKRECGETGVFQKQCHSVTFSDIPEEHRKSTKDQLSFALAQIVSAAQ
jgi:hypothetical protein